MNNTSEGPLLGATAGGVAGTHPEPPALQVLAAPATAAGSNLIRSAIFPIACFRMEDLRFDFDSSLVLPSVRQEIPLLAKLLTRHTVNAKLPPISIFGHADPVGNDDYNKALSGRRAAAVYGMLTRRTEVWEDLFQSNGKFAQAAAGDSWGTRAIQIMLNALGPEAFAPASGGAAQPLELDGKMNSPTSNALKRFQAGPLGQSAGLSSDGSAGPSTRKVLFLAYMDRICVETGFLLSDGALNALRKSGMSAAVIGKLNPLKDRSFAGRSAFTAALAGVLSAEELARHKPAIVAKARAGKPFKVDHQQGFLAHHADAEGKGDFQGCGEFNPILLFSQADKQKFEAAQDKARRNEANAPNRRVMVLLFKPGAKVTADLWPCPKAKAGVAGCHKRFWSDGEKRRSNGADQREFKDTQDTFACRFYQRLLTASPCEKPLNVLTLRLFDLLGRPLPEAPFDASVAGVDNDPDSDLDHADLNGDITLRNLALPATVTVRWSRPDSMREPSGPEPPASQTVEPLFVDEAGLDDEAIQRLFAAQENERVLRDGIRAPTETPEGFEYELEVFVTVEDGVQTATASKMTPEAARRRLNNLGYLRTVNLEDAIRVFQRDCGIAPTGKLADAQDELQRRHDQLSPPTGPNRLTGV